ncbi:TIGR02452 family protein [Adhaeretor mobilis]|uniref:Microbial-type PARG catalytic domain-containing protein n=1 Tax=Adhaeretor mobilis TaxID=1930276 RepID=A0A517MWG7_9BACT|nr:TIGR02452 family protein [Adhaeretor mobilis]QDS99222.1 hypothetical protein HG15A2_25140 [Adhaeretor mobilis]
MNRNNRKQIGSQTVEIVDRGWYELDSHGRIDIAAPVKNCLSDTRLYTPHESDDLLNNEYSRAYETVIEVENETTLSAATRLIVEQKRPNTLCLNFASAKNPGGGFLGGSQAQEESLARSSALYASLLTQNVYYETNRACRTALYTDLMILSPDVPVFRADEGSLLPDPYLLSILTSPAVNAGAVKKNEQDKEPMIIPTMTQRIAKVLTIAAEHGYEHLIFGAWGCGVFRNDPGEIAKLFAEALLDGGQFCNRFASVTFAVLDGTDGERIIRPFRQEFVKGALN